MIIAKKKNIKQLIEESHPRINELGEVIVCNERIDTQDFTVYRVGKDGFDFMGSFPKLSEAIAYGSAKENATMKHDGYTVVELHDSMALAVYYNQYESHLESSPHIGDFLSNRGFRISDEACKIGDTGISVCMAEKFLVDVQEEKEEQSLLIVDQMCCQSLDPETAEKWDHVKTVLGTTRRKLKEVELPRHITLNKDEFNAVSDLIEIHGGNLSEYSQKVLNAVRDRVSRHYGDHLQ